MSTLTGTVTDKVQQKPLSDVVVTATAPQLQGEQVVVTNEAGEYTIPDLPAGDYTLYFDAQGFSPKILRDVKLGDGATRRVDVVLLPSIT